MSDHRGDRAQAWSAPLPLTGARGDAAVRTHIAAERGRGNKRRRNRASPLRRLPAAVATLRCVAAVVLGLLTVCPVPAAAAPPLAASAGSLSHANLIRTVDLSTGGNVRETISVAVDNLGEEAVSAYHVVIPLARAGNVAHFSCTDKKTGLKLDMQKGIIEKERKLQYYKITMDPPLAPSKARTITVRFTFTGLLYPLPLEADQNDRQTLTYEGKIYFMSPYPSKKQKIVVRFPSDTILSAPQAPLPVDRSGSLITYGPYENVSSFSEEPLVAHFESLKGIVAAKSLLREFEISHWGGNAAVEEHYHFVHVGPKLKGQFRRVDYQLYSHTQHLTSVVQSLNLVLPLSARNPYYRDEIGNVSTSNFRLESVRDRSLLQLRPRYPLYGGWNYTCYLGYNMPLNEVVRAPKQDDDKGRGRYMLRAPFVHKIDGMDTWYENVEVKVVLPEGARNIDYSVPFRISRSDNSTTHTYLDTIGRPTLHLFVQMLAPEDGHLFFEVTYDLPAVELLRKPFMVASAFMAVFGAWMLSQVQTRIVP